MPPTHQNRAYFGIPHSCRSCIQSFQGSLHLGFPGIGSAIPCLCCWYAIMLTGRGRHSPPSACRWLTRRSGKAIIFRTVSRMTVLQLLSPAWLACRTKISEEMVGLRGHWDKKETIQYIWDLESNNQFNQGIFTLHDTHVKAGQLLLRLRHVYLSLPQISMPAANECLQIARATVRTHPAGHATSIPQHSRAYVQPGQQCGLPNELRSLSGSNHKFLS